MPLENETLEMNTSLEPAASLSLQRQDSEPDLSLKHAAPLLQVGAVPEPNPSFLPMVTPFLQPCHNHHLGQQSTRLHPQQGGAGVTSHSGVDLKQVIWPPSQTSFLLRKAGSFYAVRVSSKD